MPKEFNVTAVCMPEVHYMVNIDERLRKVKAMVDAENILQSTGQGNTGKPPL